MHIRNDALVFKVLQINLGIAHAERLAVFHQAIFRKPALVEIVIRHQGMRAYAASIIAAHAESNLRRA